MESIEVSKKAFIRINNLRNGDDFDLAKSNIADALTTLSDIIQAGRDEEVINAWTDDLLLVMAVVGDYNNLINDLEETSESKSGRYHYED